MSVYGAEELANSFRTVRKNTIQIAEDIPESSYDFVPAPGTKSVGTLLKHIAASPMIFEDMHRHKRITTFKGYDFPAIVSKVHAVENEPRSKAQIVEMLKSEGERFAAWLHTLTPDFLAEKVTDPTGQHSRTRLEGLMSPKEHEMHHRGQLMLIERLLGIVPHLTRQQEERMRNRPAAT